MVRKKTTAAAKAPPPPPPPPKEDKLYLNLLKSVRQYLEGRGYKPLTFKELREKLTLPVQHVAVLRKVLRNLIAEGLVLLQERRYHNKKPAEPVVRGVLTVHPRGFAFLQPDKNEGFSQDIFIPKHLTMNAVNGDIVEVVVNRATVHHEKGPEGKVVAIIERSQTHLAGIVSRIDKRGVWAYVPLLGEDRPAYIDDIGIDPPLIIGDRLVLSVEEWGSKEIPTRCSLHHRLGHISDPSCDITAAIEEHNIKAVFSTPVLNEARAYGRNVKQKDLLGREDLRHLETFTIDPETARDYDDALSLSIDEKGHYHLAVHIADVSHYVKPASALDREAQQRCNSTYFPGYCVPMLPHELSSHLCSLCAGVNRLTVSVLVELDKEGALIDYKIIRSVIRSQKRFTYEEAKEVLDGKKRSKHRETLLTMVALCGLLKKQRYQRGSIEFSLPEMVIVVDDNGVPTGTRKVEYDITHQLVEEFMLKANELVALHLFRSNKGLAYRVHDQPSPDNIREFAQMCRAFGFEIPDEPSAADFQNLFDKAVGTPFGEYLANAYIRRMRLACYSAENIGHFGLSLEHYCHFTSPIRRYIDLVIHRTLFDREYSPEELDTVALQCSEKERLSARAEQRVLMLKKLRWLTLLQEREPSRQYEAIVTRVKNFGLYFEVPDVMVEGFLHISTLGDDYYIYDGVEMQLIGERTGVIFRVADKITVQLNDVNLITMESSWHLVAHSGSGNISSRRQKGSRSQGHESEKRGRREKKEGGRRRGRRRS